MLAVCYLNVLCYLHIIISILLDYLHHHRKYVITTKKVITAQVCHHYKESYNYTGMSSLQRKL